MTRIEINLQKKCLNHMIKTRTDFVYFCPKCNKHWIDESCGQWRHLDDDWLHHVPEESYIIKGSLSCPPCNKEKGKISLEERKKTCEDLNKKIITVAKTIVNLEGIHIVDERCDEKHIHFEIDGKNYYLFIRINRVRRHHEVFDYVGKSCGDSIDDSPYVTSYKDDEEE